MEAAATSLEQRVYTSDEQTIIWNALIQALHNNGGTEVHLDRLLLDASNECQLFNQFARNIVCDICDLVRESTSLDIDFECPLSEFDKRYLNVKVQPGAKPDLTVSWTEPSPPDVSCQYKLIRFDHPMPNEKIHNFDLATFSRPSKEKIEHAGWRELIAYCDRLMPEYLASRCIIAAGSLKRQRSRYFDDFEVNAREPCFPCALANREQVTISWRGTNKLEELKYGLDDFYLVRVSQ